MDKNFANPIEPQKSEKMSIPVEKNTSNNESIGIAFSKELENITPDDKSCKFINFCSGCLGCVGCVGCGGGGGSAREITDEEIVL